MAAGQVDQSTRIGVVRARLMTVDGLMSIEHSFMVNYVGKFAVSEPRQSNATVDTDGQMGLRLSGFTMHGRPQIMDMGGNWLGSVNDQYYWSFDVEILSSDWVYGRILTCDIEIEAWRPLP